MYYCQTFISVDTNYIILLLLIYIVLLHLAH